MLLTERKGDLFAVSDDYVLAHCISSDCAMGAGIAVAFEREFALRNRLKALPIEERQHPTCIKVGKVFNLITKERYYQKPTYASVRSTLTCMKEQSLRDGISKIAMPRIASGLDRLDWQQVKEIVKEVFEGTDIEILVCSLPCTV